MKPGENTSKRKEDEIVQLLQNDFVKYCNYYFRILCN
jgi:hypothetical protein